MQQPEFRLSTSLFGPVRAARKVKTRVWLLPVLALVATVACDKVPLTSPTGSTITLSVSQTTVPINGTIEVVAAVIEAGGTAVHDGTSVIFTGGLGSFTPLEAQTVGGLARSFFKGATSGTVKLGAFSGAAKATEVEVKVGTAAATTIGISATPSSVSQSGGTVTVAAQVFDVSGNALSGVNVTFSADAGQLSATTALTDANGVARTQLTTFQTAKVTATAGAATKDVTVNVTAAPTVTIDAPATAVVGVPVAITIAAPTAAGARQLQSVVVDFGDGTSQTISNPTGSAGLTHTYRNSGGFTITARSTDVAGNTGIATRGIVVQPAIPTVTVSATPNNGTAPFTSTIAGTASPANNGPAIQGVRVLVNGDQVFSTSGGGSFSFAFRFGTAGTYTVNAIATDTNGNESRASTIVIAQ